jgi:hypothetical protein
MTRRCDATEARENLEHHDEAKRAIRSSCGKKIEGEDNDHFPLMSLVVRQIRQRYLLKSDLGAVVWLELAQTSP